MPRRIAGNSLLLFSGQVLTRMASLGIFVLIARVLGPADVGTFGFAVSAVALFVILVDFGVDQVLVREASGDPALATDWLRVSIRAKTWVFVLSYPLLLLAVLAVAEHAALVVLIAILGAAAWHETVIRSLGYLMLGRGSAVFLLGIDTLTWAVRVLAVAGVLLAGLGIVAVAAAYFLGSATSAVMLLVLRRGDGAGLGGSRGPGAPIRDLLNEAWPFFVYGLLFQIYFRSDILLLGVFRTSPEVGEYVVAYRVVEAMLGGLAAITGALYPAFARLYREGARAKLEDTAARATRLMTTGTLAASLGLGLLAPQLVLAIGGPEFISAPTYLRLLLPTAVLISANAVSLLVLNTAKAQRVTMLVMGIGALTNLALNVLYIPRYGATAACATTLATEVVMTAFLIVCARKWFSVGAWIRAFAPGLTAAAFAVAALLVLQSPLWVRAVAGLLVFAGGAHVVGAVQRDEWWEVTLGLWGQLRMLRSRSS